MTEIVTPRSSREGGVERFLAGETVPIVDSLKGLEGVDRFECGLVAAQLALSRTFNSVHNWTHRIPTSRILKPEDFNGNFFNIEVSPLEDPIAEYLSLFSKLRAGAAVTGYRVTADMDSTGRGVVDKLDRRVWIVKRPENSIEARDQSPYVRRLCKNVPTLYSAANNAAYIVRNMLDRQAVKRPLSSGFESSRYK
jgi:hypothetical protein